MFSSLKGMGLEIERFMSNSLVNNGDIMIYYIHGYLSSTYGTKGTLFKRKLHAIPIKYRDCEPEDLIISDCLNMIKNEIENEDEIILIGSSLGGFLAAKTALDCRYVRKLILLNPAIIPYDFDIKKISDMPQSILIDMKEELFFKEKISSDIFVIIGTDDEIVSNSWGIDFAMFQEAYVKFIKDDHSFSKNIENLPMIISEFINKKN
jgi:predicted esterase YcpF (UPF0227 family)